MTGVSKPAIPALGGRVDPDVRRAIRALADYLQHVYQQTGGYALPGGTTGGESSETIIQNITNPVVGVEDPGTTIPTPDGVIVTGLYNKLMIEWNSPGANYPWLAYAQVYWNTVDHLGTASLLTNVPYPQAMTIHTPPDTSTAEVYYYWVRFVTITDRIGGWNATAGTSGSTATDPAYLLEELAGQLGYDQFDVANGIFPVRVVSALPSLPDAAWPAGALAYLTSDGKLYRTDGTTWTTAVATSDLSGQIEATQFAATIEPVSIVSALPNPAGYTGPKVVFLTTDGKLYRYSGEDWTVAVPTTDLTGTISDAQIAALAAAKITGQLSDAQLAAIAAAKITGTIGTTQISDDAITTPKLAAGSVTANEIAANAIIAGKIAAGVITTTELAAGAVTAAKIVAGTITAAEIAAGAITTAKLAAAAVTANEIAANAIIAGKIAAAAISATEIAAGAITTAKLAAGAVTANEIAANAIIAGKIAAAAILASHIGANEVIANSANIANGVITNAKIANLAVDSAKIDTAAIVEAKIASLAVTEAKIASAAITEAKIANLAVTEAKIANAAITNAKIGTAAITTAKIGTAQVTTLLLGNEAVTIPRSYVNTTKVLSKDGYHTTLATITFDGKGGDVLVTLTGVCQYLNEGASVPSTARCYVEFWVGSTLIDTRDITDLFSYLDESTTIYSPISGPFAYTQRVPGVNTNGTKEYLIRARTTYGDAYISNRAMICLGVQR